MSKPATLIRRTGEKTRIGNENPYQKGRFAASLMDMKRAKHTCQGALRAF